ncbi:MAG: DUF1553 domain-containing protein [Planctomycetes bacterium]|nr:DUF1553 domain-containing protein [Planctomycetota bacterium]
MPSLLIWALALSPAAGPVSFSRDILPILSDKCLACHGPDAAARKAGLRLDDAASARAAGAVVPGKPAESELISRVHSPDPSVVMPPPGFGKSLNAREKALLADWIASGARHERHWAFNPVTRPRVPAAGAQARNPVDAFVLDRLAREKIAPAPLAPPHVLARRLALDLTGLPPSENLLGALAADSSGPGMVAAANRLMDTGAHAERMAWDWLDAARYADTDGFQGDAERTNWPWRDWVVGAFRSNMPFDRFTLEQFAGDLLPGATPEQVLATAFHRHHMTNGEGGRDPEESRVDYVIDRVNTVGTAWLGLTLGCSQCHDHKYDPVSQADYYRLSAFFDSIDEDGRAGKGAKPYLKYDSPFAARALAAAEELVAARKAAEAAARSAAAEPFNAWLARLRGEVARGKRAWEPARPLAAEAVEGTALAIVGDLVEAGGPAPRQDDYKVAFRPASLPLTGIRLEVLPGPGGLGRGADGHVILTDVKLAVRPSGSEQARDVAIASAVADFQPDSKKHGGYGNARDTLDDDPRNGWASFERDNRQARALVFALAEPLDLAAGDRVVLELRHRSTEGHRSMARFRVLSTDQAGEAARTTAAAPVDELAKLGAAEVPEALRKRLFEQFLAGHAPHQAARDALARAEKQRAEAKAAKSVDVMVLAERKQPRSTHVLVRGAWDKKGAKVERDAIAGLARWPEGAPRDRAGLARWLVSRDNPLTARVVVNRLWQQCFGAGLVRTPEDFGLQGEAPTHPELLDWLASEFIDSGWDQRHVLRLLVGSAAYARASSVTPALLARDPENRLLARQARFRMPSWMIRDVSLAASGLLNPAVGGPPVRPPQPAGVWEDISMGRNKYEVTEGPERHRRTLYAFWRRAAAPAFLFDIAQRRVCEVRAPRTNTPMQALALRNDPGRLEAARALAAQPAEPAAMFRRVLSRDPSPAELEILRRELDRARRAFAASPADARRYLEAAGGELKDTADPVAWASRAVLAGLILNLDEAISRE